MTPLLEKISIITAIVIAAISCRSSDNSIPIEEVMPTVKAIGQYVTDVYQDDDENLWFGTIEKGLARYDGKELKYFTTDDGLPSDRVVSITEDASGNIWLGTGNGISIFDGKKFRDLKLPDGICNNSISSIQFGPDSVLWIGTWGGLCTYDEGEFSSFLMPVPEVTTPINPDTKDWITEIEMDDHGIIWIARDGSGMYRYDGKDFRHFHKKDGLLSNGVTEIEVDDKGDVWIGSRLTERDFDVKAPGSAGVNKLTDGEMTSFPVMEAFNNSEVYEIYKDRKGNIWISTVKYGVYRYDGQDFTHHDVPISIMCMTEDKNGNLWLGGAGGLYRINSNGDVNYVSQAGPWE